MTWLIVGLIVVALIVATALLATRMRSRALHERFGPEYDRLVAEEGNRRRAEAEMSHRVKRRGELEIVDLDPAARQGYVEEWRAVQERFIDEPAESVADADELVQRVMRDRGYPVDEFDERVEMVTVDHPELAENYRAAHAVQVRSSQDEASTDEFRDAFRRYRSLFAELLAESTPAVEDENEHDEVTERGGQ